MKRGRFHVCDSSWCEKCFVPLGTRPFQIRTTLDEDGKVLKKDEDVDRFLEGRDGDHLITPFQCELCHFRNIQDRDPVVGNKKDESFLEHMRRVTLDAFWGREASTVRSNLGLLRRAAKTEDTFGCVNKIIPAVGPYPLEDTFGMGAAIAVLDKSMDPGRYEVYVQWATFRKMRSSLTNVGQAGCGGLGDAIGASDKNRTWVTGVDTHKFFFSRFMNGIHRRVGEEVRRDEPVTIGVMKEIQRTLEERWATETRMVRPSKARLIRLALTGYWFVVGFCTAVRGEENGLIEFKGTHASLENLSSPPEGLEKHFESVIAGPTKGNRLSGSKFAIPCVSETKGNGLRPGIWAMRYCRMLKTSGQVGGYLFPDPLSHYEDMFYSMLEDVQARRKDLIKPTVDVREEFGIHRSLRRGVTSHALNMGIDKGLVDAVNRWRSELNSEVARLDMAGSYARLDSIKPAILRYSEKL